MTEEGVIKFCVDHTHTALTPRRYGDLACSLIAWRELLTGARLLGQDPTRYGGAGYGNISARIGAPSSPRGARPFLISGTQTSGLQAISLEELCVVSRYDLVANTAVSEGLLHPSSESLTHGAIYDLSPHIRAVIHAHAPALWGRARKLNLPITDPHATYGTTALAYDVQRLYRSTALPETQLLALGGHEDGVFVFGRNIEEAGGVLMKTLARAYEGLCADQGIRLGL